MSEIFLHLTAGQGPKECQWVVVQLAKAFAREAAKLDLTCEVVEDGGANATASLLLRVDGSNSEAFVAVREGSVLWVGQSPFRPNHRRKNWFVGVTRLPPAEDIAHLRDSDIRYQTLRASGPGGQHVNKTDSAVRAIHEPTGLTAFSQDQRSQFANKKMAKLKLALLLRDQADRNVADDKKAEWSRNHDLERGNPVRTYVGTAFKLKPG